MLAPLASTSEKGFLGPQLHLPGGPCLSLYRLSLPWPSPTPHSQPHGYCPALGRRPTVGCGVGEGQAGLRHLRSLCPSQAWHRTQWQEGLPFQVISPQRVMVQHCEQEACSVLLARLGRHQAGWGTVGLRCQPPHTHGFTPKGQDWEKDATERWGGAYCQVCSQPGIAQATWSDACSG